MEQCENLDYPKPEPRTLDFSPIAECDRIITHMPTPPRLTNLESQAFYRRSEDRVNLPPRETFEGEEAYYATMFHELTHATGHETRLARFQPLENNAFGSKPYAKEELIAEMGAAFLCGTAGITNPTIDQSASYIAAWLGKLKEDRKLVVQAASAAHRAADFILGNIKEEVK